MVTTSILKSYLSFVWDLATPKTISYMWGFGSFLGVIMLAQILSGIVLAFYYVSGVSAWNSVIELTREVSYGWLLRLIHSNTASFVFVILFIHFFRGLLNSSFYLKGPWLSGWLIMILTMAAAFLGYVLPWGQMSFWGATVIINLISVLPMGKTLVIWLWGGFYVSFFTCSFFYAFHFLVPFLVLGMAGAHLLLLHFSGSNNTSGLSGSSILKVKFGQLFLFKDMINLGLLWCFWLWALAYPDWSADPVNFSPSDLSNSPIHIQPEWYFLHLYAVLRSIPNKLGGLIGFVLAILVLSILVMVYSFQSMSLMKSYSLVFWSFLSCNLILVWLGSQPVEVPFVGMGQILTLFYFLSISMILSMDKIMIILHVFMASKVTSD